MKVISVVVEMKDFPEDEQCKMPDKIDEIVKPYHLKWFFRNMYLVEKGFDEDLAIFGAIKALKETEELKKRVHVGVWNSISTCKLEEICTGDMSEPKEEKVKKYRDYFEEHGISEYRVSYPNPIVVDEHHNLLDGYVSYLIMKEKGFTRAECLLNESGIQFKKYICGIHHLENNKKEYRWAYPLEEAVVPGDHLLVDTKFGDKIIKVTRVEMGTEGYVDSLRKVKKQVSVRDRKPIGKK